MRYWIFHVFLVACCHSSVYLYKRQEFSCFFKWPVMRLGRRINEHLVLEMNMRDRAAGTVNSVTLTRYRWNSGMKLGLLKNSPGFIWLPVDVSLRVLCSSISGGGKEQGRESCNHHCDRAQWDIFLRSLGLEGWTIVFLNAPVARR